MLSTRSFASHYTGLWAAGSDFSTESSCLCRWYREAPNLRKDASQETSIEWATAQELTRFVWDQGSAVSGQRLRVLIFALGCASDWHR